MQFLLDEKARVWESVPEVFATLMKYHARKVSDTLQLVIYMLTLVHVRLYICTCICTMHTVLSRRLIGP